MWQNWSGTARADPVHTSRPHTAEQIADQVRAAAHRGLTVRPLGSGHSFTAIGAPHGLALDLTRWSGITDIDGDLVTVRSGTVLRDLNTALHAAGLALPNLGDIDAQTVGGALATGTHGTGATLGGLATQVAALDMVLADGSTVHCSATENPDLFAAARVGLGALGVLTTVTLRCVPSFVLQADERPLPLETVLAEFDTLTTDNDHFEFYWFPYGAQALVKRNNRTADTPAPLSRTRQFLEYRIMENTAFGTVCRLGRAMPALAKPLQRMASRALSTRDYRDWSHRVFVTSRTVRFVESEYAIPRSAVVDVIRELRDRIAQLTHPVLFPVEVRVAAADDIWLSTAYQRDTAYLAIHQYRGMPYQEYFALFESIVDSVDGRPHWGKLHGLDATALRERYPRFDDFLALRDKLDPDRRFGNPYLETVLG